MTNTTDSLLTGKHILQVLEALQIAEFFPINPTPEQIGVLRAKAASAAITLRVWSGIQDVSIPVVEAA